MPRPTAIARDCSSADAPEPGPLAPLIEGERKEVNACDQKKRGGTESTTAQGAARSREVGQESIPVDGDAGYGGDGGLTLQLENSRASVTTGFEPIDSQRPIRRMY
jgi:hypothetical protein